MQYIGFDVHKQSFSATIIDSDTGQITRYRGPVTRQTLQECLSTPGPKKAVFEAGRTWSLFYEMIQDLVDDVKMAHPLKVRAIAEAKVKTDAIDATTLAQLLSADLIPPSYLRSRSNQDHQRVLRQRVFFVQMRTRLKNRIHVLIDRQWPEVRAALADLTDLFGKRGLCLLRTLSLPHRDRQLLDEMLSTYDFISSQVKASDRRIKDLYNHDLDAQRLATIPGLGVFFATLVRVEIGQIERFKRPSHLCSYAGLTPSTFQSGQKHWGGRINKQGNRWLRWAMAEAVSPAVSHYAPLRSYHQRVKYRKGVHTARMATARRLLTIAFHILKEKRAFIRDKSQDRVAFICP